VAWKELRGTRRVEDNAPHYVDWIITFGGTVGTEVKPNPGDTITNIIGTKSLPTGTGAGGDGVNGDLLDATPRAVQVSQVHRVTPSETRVTVRFRAWYIEA